MITPSLRIAILTHSTNPRGGVVHGLELAEALTQLGHSVTVHAPDVTGSKFFRSTRAQTLCIAASASEEGIWAMIQARIGDYLKHFENPANRRFDIFHAQDGISGNALADLKRRGLIPAFAQTVHHLDEHQDGRVESLQKCPILEADRLLVVSRLWFDRLGREFSRSATLVGNGVDRLRFNPIPSTADRDLRNRLGLRHGPVFLSVGGIERRKNSVRILQAFRQVHAIEPRAQLVIAGGASVLDHRSYLAEFEEVLAWSDLPKHTIVRTGVLKDEEMPSLYRISDVLVFPSLTEGYGLVVLEAMASGLPVVASHHAPFTEYLTDDDVAWCDPLNAGSIANAMAAVLAEPHRSRLARNGLRVAERHNWLATARAHLAVYGSIRELQRA